MRERSAFLEIFLFISLGADFCFTRFCTWAAHVGGHKGIGPFKLECVAAFTHLLVIDGSFPILFCY